MPSLIPAWLVRTPARNHPSGSTAHTLVLNAARKLLSGRDALFRQLRDRLQQRGRADIRRWRDALAAAEHPERPNRRHMLDLFHDILLDAHLAGIVMVRRQRLQAAVGHVYDAQGRVDVAASRLLRQGWLADLAAAVLDAELYGYSLVELYTGADGQVQVANLPRANVSPEAGALTLDAQTPMPAVVPGPLPTGWLALDHLPQALVFIGKPRGQGLLNAAVPLVLMKRNAMACWSEFAEVFGMPVRIGRTNARDTRRKQELAAMLQQMGSAAYAVLDEGDQIEFVENQKGDAFRVFDRLIERCNLELSKLVNGQTLTTEPGDRGARALGQIHDDIFDDVTRADLLRTARVLNEQVLPQLAQLPAYRALAGLHFAFDLDATTLSPREQWTIDAGLLQHYRIPAAYFREKYGVPVQDAPEPASR